MTLTIEQIENLRDKTFCRTLGLQLKDVDDAERFVESTGFCFAFKMNKSELPCMWHAAAGQRDPDYPKHVQHDPFIGLVWNAKDALPAAKKVYYGKALKKRPTFISLQFLPAFYLMQKRTNNAEDYVADYMRGELSAPAKRIMDSIWEQSPLVTADLKMASNLAHPEKRSIFDKAMAELQGKMYIVKIGEFYNPFTFLWDVFDRRFEKEILIAKTMTDSEAREKILQRYFQTRWAAHEKEIQRLFLWTPLEVQQTLAALHAKGEIQGDVAIENEKQKFWVSSKINLA
jgi:hypothetical protein